MLASRLSESAAASGDLLSAQPSLHSNNHAKPKLTYGMLDSVCATSTDSQRALFMQNNEGPACCNSISDTSLSLEASVAERAALAVLDDFTEIFNLENESSHMPAERTDDLVRSCQSSAKDDGAYTNRLTGIHRPGSCGTDVDGARSTGVGPIMRPKLRPPEDLFCPLSHELMLDPVLAADGHAYERRHIEDWFSRHLTSPLTGERLNNPSLLPCHALRKMAQVYSGAAPDTPPTDMS